MYQIVGKDGNLYGPADIPTLKEWVAEGRLTPDMTVIDYLTNLSGPAGMLMQDLGVFPLAVPPIVQNYAPPVASYEPPNYQNSPRNYPNNPARYPDSAGNYQNNPAVNQDDSYPNYLPNSHNSPPGRPDRGYLDPNVAMQPSDMDLHANYVSVQTNVNVNPPSPQVYPPQMGVQTNIVVNQYAPIQPQRASEMAGLGSRLGGFIIDVLIISPIALLSAIPIVGILFSLLYCLYMLSRDSNGGRSFGKRMTRTRVVRLDGGEVGWGQSVLRNIVYTPILFFMIPIAGIPIGSGILSLVGFVEIIFVLTTKRRIGDHFANTVVMTD